MFALTVQSPWASDSGEVLTERLRNQRLIESTTRKPEQVVAWSCAMQAQDYAAAKWAVGLRAQHCHDADVDHAFNEGLILRTHVLRPTWHFVTPADIRWLIELSGPRVHAVNAYYYRQLGLDAKVFAKSCAMMHRVLEGGDTMTRAELAQHLKRARIPADGLKLGYLMMHAELEGVICSGPRRGKQFTYALLDACAPAATRRSREESLATLARRYFASHGPATVRDFSWWSGFTLTESQRAVDAVTPALDSAVIGGLKYWSAGDSGKPAAKPPVMLLPNYDEYLIAYKDRGLVVDAARAANIAARANSALANHLIIDGRLAGGWSRTITGNSVKVDVSPYKKLTPVQMRGLVQAVDAYGEFLGLPATLSVV